MTPSPFKKHQKHSLDKWRESDRIPGNRKVQAGERQRGRDACREMLGHVDAARVFALQPGDFGDPLGLVEKNIGQSLHCNLFS